VAEERRGASLGGRDEALQGHPVHERGEAAQFEQGAAGPGRVLLQPLPVGREEVQRLLAAAGRFVGAFQVKLQPLQVLVDALLHLGNIQSQESNEQTDSCDRSSTLETSVTAFSRAARRRENLSSDRRSS